jgi:hypothetical protein
LNGLNKTDHKTTITNMAHIDVEYTVTVNLLDLEIPNNQSRIDAEKKIKEIAQAKLRAWVTGNAFDPQGKVFVENIRIITKP